MSELVRLRGSERYGACDDDAAGSLRQRLASGVAPPGFFCYGHANSRVGLCHAFTLRGRWQLHADG